MAKITKDTIIGDILDSHYEKTTVKECVNCGARKDK